MKKLLKLMVGAGMMMSVPFAVANSKIEEVFSYDMIGTDLAYLESIIGVARKTNTYNDTKEYVVNGCQLEVGYNGQSIETLSVDLTDRCQFQLKDIISDETIPSNKVVFGMTGPVYYYADCLIGCGNAYDPAVHELYQGSRAEGFRELLLSSISGPFEARWKWRDAMIAKEGEDWVIDGRYNCEPSTHRDIAENALKGQKVDTITIGYNLEERKTLKEWCEDYQRNNYQAPQAASEEVKEIPYQVAYQDEDYTYLVGSQILEGEVMYEPNDMYGHRIEFIPNAATSKSLGLPQNFRFVLDDYSGMNQEQLIGANYYLGFNVDFDSPKFQNSYCTINGNAKLQIIGISLYLPEESEPHVYVRSLKNIESGPFNVKCQ